jgi:hypothetical protein
MKVPARLTTLALAAVCFAALAATASAATPTLVGHSYLVPPGKTVTFSNITMNSCNTDWAGVNVSQDGVDGFVAGLNFGSNMGQECGRVGLAAQSYTNNSSADQTATLWFYDAICSIHFGGTNHQLITPDRALYNDAGSDKKRGMDCSKADSRSVPTAKKNNFSAQVSID